MALGVRFLSLRSPRGKDGFVVKGVGFSVCRGEVLGIFGLMGAGRTELLEALFGLHPRQTQGAIQLEGAPVRIRSPQDAIRAGIVLAPEDRKARGLILPMSVGANASLSALPACERWGLIQPQKEQNLVGNFIRRLQIKTSDLRQSVQNLSGGNQQKVVLAKWLSTQPKVLLLDEPTRGVDVNAKKEIYHLIDEWTQSGLAVVMVSSELPEVLAISDRILVLCEGRKTAEFARQEASEESIMEAALPC